MSDLVQAPPILHALKSPVRVRQEGLGGQLAYRFAHPIHTSDASHINRQITSDKIQSRQSGQYYGGYSGEYLAPRNA